MRIPKNLKHLGRKDEDSLLLVTGKQDAVIYKASKGYLYKLDSFKLSTPVYSDNEGKGGATGSGTGRGHGQRSMVQKELQDRDIVRDFIHELIIHLKNIGADKIPSIYLFTPSYVKNQIMNALPTDLRHHIKAVVEGNYFNMAPSELMLKLA
jgi:hypothetical protein